MSHLVWLVTTFAAVGHLITDAGLVLTVVLLVAANLAELMSTVLLRIQWRSTSRVNLRLLRRNKGDSMITIEEYLSFPTAYLTLGVHSFAVSCPGVHVFPSL